MFVPPANRVIAWKANAGRAFGQTHITRRPWVQGVANVTLCSKPVPVDAADYADDSEPCARCFDRYEKNGR